MKGHNMMLNQQQQNIQPQICLKSSKYGKKKKRKQYRIKLQNGNSQTLMQTHNKNKKTG